MLEIIKCVRCGGGLEPVSRGVYRCVCCGSEWTEKERDVESAVMAGLGDMKYELLSAARQNLWRAMHAGTIDSAACLSYARELKKYAPSDYYANFAEVANSESDAEISAFLSSSKKEDRDEYADAVLDFMIMSLTEGTLAAVGEYLGKAFPKSSGSYAEYIEKLESEAEKVSHGIYDLNMPRDVFLAYSSRDSQKVTELCDFLESLGITCFLSSRNLRHGRGAVDNYDEAIKTAVDNCRVFVFVSSESSRRVGCTAYRVEMPYVRKKDLDGAPAELKKSYEKLPSAYKKDRVEYLIDDYGGLPTEREAKEFFAGFEWCLTKEAVAERVTRHLTSEPDSPESSAEAEAPGNVPEKADVGVVSIPSPEKKTYNPARANAEQAEAVSATEGPLLITAGPGTGKTFTLVQRCAHLIKDLRVKPEEIMIATFTDKAAGELVTRLRSELPSDAALEKMYVGTFHSISLRILREHLDETRLDRGFVLLDEFDQKYLVWRNLDMFEKIPDFCLAVGDTDDFGVTRTEWGRAEKICVFVNNLSEELVDATALQKDADPAVRALGNIFATYMKLLGESNCIDFSGLQTECLRLLKTHPEILSALRGEIRYVMVDEYQDTNYVQEQLVFLLGGGTYNICVVGDDDQGLYRFRGATIRNILEFPERMREFGQKCGRVSLLTNYRSETGIIDFYNNWMSATSGAKFSFDWGGCRYDKRIVASPDKKRNDACVYRLFAENDAGDWANRIAEYLWKLKNDGVIKDFNEAAFLFRSVRSRPVVALAAYLEGTGIHVNSPRSGMLFDRDETRLSVGCLIKCFPHYESALRSGGFAEKIGSDFRSYLTSCADYAGTVSEMPENSGLKELLRRLSLSHSAMKGSAGYVFSGLLEMFYAQRPFCDILTAGEGDGIIEVRRAKNLGVFSDLVKKFESLYGVKALNAYAVEELTKTLFNQYLRLLYNNRTNEYEFESGSVPRGCVSFMTIHQSKGMEFPLVFVDSLGSTPSDQSDGLTDRVGKKYFQRSPFEPEGSTKYFDFWRLYYVAFSRAKKILVLTYNERSYGRYCEPSYCFEDTLRTLRKL